MYIKIYRSKESEIKKQQKNTYTEEDTYIKKERKKYLHTSINKQLTYTHMIVELINENEVVQLIFMYLAESKVFNNRDLSYII